MDNSLNQITYDRFKKDILIFNLSPGDSVSAAKIAVRYGVSRTPAREALVKLETEGLVEIIPQSRSVISRIDLQRAKQEWFVRRSLELSMVDMIFDSITDADIDRMVAYNEEMLQLASHAGNHEDCYNYLLADNAFHAVTYEACGQHLSASVIGNTMAHYSRLRFLTEMEDIYRDRTLGGHQGLIECLRKRDSAGYRERLSVHLGHILNDIEILLTKYPNYFESK